MSGLLKHYHKLRKKILPASKEDISWRHDYVDARLDFIAARLNAVNSKLDATHSSIAAITERLGTQEATAPSAGRYIDGPPQRVDVTTTPIERARMFDHINETWCRLGDSEPHWSVWTSEKFKTAHIEANERDFYASGGTDANLIKGFFERNGQQLENVRTCLELGCGVGRATSAIARIFPSVIGVDISGPHLALANRWLQQQGISNTTLVRLSSVEALSELPSFDLLFSRVVLQHNPPPVIHYILDSLLSKVNRNGYVLFQVPTYAADYSFVASDYLKSMSAAEGGMEMHVLPQKAIFELFSRHNLSSLEVHEDNATGSSRFLSHTFFARRGPE